MFYSDDNLEPTVKDLRLKIEYSTSFLTQQIHNEDFESAAAVKRKIQELTAALDKATKEQAARFSKTPFPDRAKLFEDLNTASSKKSEDLLRVWGDDLTATRYLLGQFLGYSAAHGNDIVCFRSGGSRSAFEVLFQSWPLLVFGSGFTRDLERRYSAHKEPIIGEYLRFVSQFQIPEEAITAANRVFTSRDAFNLLKFQLQRDNYYVGWYDPTLNLRPWLGKLGSLSRHLGPFRKLGPGEDAVRLSHDPDFADGNAFLCFSLIGENTARSKGSSESELPVYLQTKLTRAHLRAHASKSFSDSYTPALYSNSFWKLAVGDRGSVVLDLDLVLWNGRVSEQQRQSKCLGKFIF